MPTSKPPLNGNHGDGLVVGLQCSPIKMVGLQCPLTNVVVSQCPPNNGPPWGQGRGQPWMQGGPGQHGI